MAKERVVFTEFDPPGDAGIDCSVEESLTQQEFKEECDINKIVARHVGGMPPPVVGGATYGDFSDVDDFQAAQETVKRAQELFSQLEGRVRQRFNNDPAELLAFVSDKANLKEAQELGLLKDIPKPPPEPPKAGA